MISLQDRREILISYLKAKVCEADWHGVSDAANDLRVLEAQLNILQSRRTFKDQENDQADSRSDSRSAQEFSRPSATQGNEETQGFSE